MTTELSRRQRLTIGALLMALGAGVSLAIHFHPQQLRPPRGSPRRCRIPLRWPVPRLIISAYEAKKLVSWLGVLIVMALLVPFLFR